VICPTALLRATVLDLKNKDMCSHVNIKATCSTGIRSYTSVQLT